MSIMTVDVFFFFNDDLLTEVLLFEYFNISKVLSGPLSSKMTDN